VQARAIGATPGDVVRFPTGEAVARELDRPTTTIVTTGPVPAVLDAIKDRERERETLVRELAALDLERAAIRTCLDLERRARRLDVHPSARRHDEHCAAVERDGGPILHGRRRDSAAAGGANSHHRREYRGSRGAALYSERLGRLHGYRRGILVETDAHD
jgi:hypothetical protein